LQQNSLRIDHLLLLSIRVLRLSLLLLITQLQLGCLLLLVRSRLLLDFSLDLLVMLDPRYHWLESALHVEDFELLSERKPELQDLLK